MASALGSFEQLRLRGLEAYEGFYRFVTEADALEQWAQNETRDRPLQFRQLAATLPTPVPELPFRLVANIANHAASGDLEDHYGLQEATGRQDAAPLREWFGEAREELTLLVPEAFRSELLWLRWVPPRSQAPFEAGRISFDQLTSVAFQFASASDAVQAGPVGTLHVLLRDWAADLDPLLRELEIGQELVWRAAEVAREERDLTAVLREVESTEERLREQVSLPTSSWTILAALALRAETRELIPGRDAEDILAASRRLADTWTSHDAVGESGEARPSTAVTTDVWTDNDQLEYELYADAIASFIRDEKTVAPLTIGIKAPWGAGKTSLMRMVRKRLDAAAFPAASEGSPRLAGSAEPTPAKTRRGWRLGMRGTARTSPADEDVLTNGETLDKTRLPPEIAAQELAIDDLDTGAERMTIWFNAWKYQSGEQLWAGLAHAIISQVEQRMTRFQRERFWASLNVRRVDLAAVRRGIYRAFALRVAPYVLAVPLFGAITIPFWVVSSMLGATIFGVGTLAAAAHIAVRWGRFLKEDVGSATPGLVRDPGYEGRLGFLHLVDDDMHRILELVASPDRPLVVFVDDLDRCSYTTVAQVIEALNTFLAGDYANCIFVIAMEPDLVAAQIHVAYEKLFERMEEQDAQGGDLGWRFLEKMVQLPLSLPPPQAPQIERFVDSILAIESEAKIAILDDNAPQVVEMRKAIRRAETTGTLEAIPSAVESVRRQMESSGAPPENLEEALQKAARLEFVERFDDVLVRDMILAYAADLAGNPREIKRFINVFRFYAYVDFWRGIRPLETPGREGAARLARLAVGWPHLLSALGNEVTRNGRTARLLVWLEEAAIDDEEWHEALELVPERLRGGLGAASGFRRAVAREPLVGEKAGGFL